jgi:hypothetical protein
MTTLGRGRHLATPMRDVYEDGEDDDAEDDDRHPDDPRFHV